MSGPSQARHFKACNEKLLAMVFIHVIRHTQHNESNKSKTYRSSVMFAIYWLFKLSVNSLGISFQSFHLLHMVDNDI